MKTIENLKQDLFNLVPDKNTELIFKKDTAKFNVEFNKIESEIEKHPNKNEMIPILLEFIEKYPSIDYGMPGSICHLLEGMCDEYAKYIKNHIKNYTARYIWRVLYFRFFCDFDNAHEAKKAYQNIEYAKECGILDDDDFDDMRTELDEYMEE